MTRETSGDPDPAGNTRGHPADREEPDGVLLPFPLRRPPRLAEPHPPDRHTRGALAAAILTLPAGADRPEPGAEDTESRLTGFAELVATTISDALIRPELDNSRARIVAAADESRRRIERDLHDGAQQRLIALAIQARLAQAAVPEGPGELASRLDALTTEANRAVVELRELARGIHPAELAEGGLRPALRALARRSAVPVDLDVRVDGRFPEQVESAAYFVVAEALTNAAKHADAAQVSVSVSVEAEVVRIRVGDDGRGGAEMGAGSGLLGLKDRVEALGGRFSLATVPGTTISAELPLARRPAIRT